jgi:hypothetical protein
MSKISLTKDEKRAYLSQEPKMTDVYLNLVAREKLPKSKKIVRDVEYAIGLARKFNNEVVRPIYKKVDLAVTKDPNYLCWDYINKANEWGLFTLFNA